MKKLRILIFALILCLIFNLSFADDALKIAVLDFQNLTQQEDLYFLERAIPEILITDLLQSDKLTIVERAHLDKILDEMELSLSGMIDEEQVVEVGKMSGANSILVGSIIRAGDVFRIDARLTDVASSEIILAETCNWLSEDEIIAAIDLLAEQIIFKLSGEKISFEETNNEEHYTSETTLAMETQLDNEYWLSGSDKNVNLQIDLYSKEINKNNRLPINISLVIDKSGSMASENKLTYAKNAALYVANNLNKDDKFSLVCYDDSVSIPIRAQKIENLDYIKWAIDRIYPGNATNLSAGIAEGYNQAAKYFESTQVNRILLLSDGLANRGISDTKSLSKICQEQSAQGTSISSFGVGLDFNEDLMLNLAEYGKGNYYYIQSPSQIPDIFNRELNGLLAVSAQNVALIIDVPEGVIVEDVAGYLFTQKDGKTIIDLGDIYSNDHKTIIVKLKPNVDYDGEMKLAEVSLEYDDVSSDGTKIVEYSDLNINCTQNKRLVNQHVNHNVSGNVVLLQSTQNMQSAFGNVDNGEIILAKAIVENEKEVVTKNLSMMTSKQSKKQILAIHQYDMALSKIVDEPIASTSIKSIQKRSKSKQYEIQKNKDNSSTNWLEINSGKNEEPKPIDIDTTKVRPRPIPDPDPTPRPFPFPDPNPPTPQPTPFPDPQPTPPMPTPIPDPKPLPIDDDININEDSMRVHIGPYPRPKPKPIIIPDKKPNIIDPKIKIDDEKPYDVPQKLPLRKREERKKEPIKINPGVKDKTESKEVNHDVPTIDPPRPKPLYPDDIFNPKPNPKPVIVPNTVNNKTNKNKFRIKKEKPAKQKQITVKKTEPTRTVIRPSKPKNNSSKNEIKPIKIKKKTVKSTNNDSNKSTSTPKKKKKQFLKKKKDN